MNGRPGPKIVAPPPGPQARRLMEEDNRFLSTSLSRTSHLMGQSAQGPYVTDVDGNVFLDFGSGIAVTVAGHCHPHIVQAIQRQAAELIHVNSCDYMSTPQVEYARRLTTLTPGDFPKRVFFSNSGTEAIECGLKSAVYHSGRSGIIAFIGGFHGRTMGSLAITSNSPVSRRRYTASLMPNVAFSPYAYCYRCPFSQEYPGCELECLDYLENWVLGKVMPPEDCAAIVVEPVQGAGGFVVPPLEFLQGVERICCENDIYLMVDEVQTSFAKTGVMFGCDYFGITPDILCISKAIAAGLPMGATVTRADLLDWELNTHENTLGGNPVVVSAALAVLDVCESENLMVSAIRIGDRIRSALLEMQSRYSIIGDVRPAGALIGIEFVLDRDTKAPAIEQRNAFVERCFQKGLLALGAGASSIRLAPPLILTDEEVDIGVSIMEDVISDL